MPKTTSFSNSRHCPVIFFNSNGQFLTSSFIKASLPCCPNPPTKFPLTAHKGTKSFNYTFGVLSTWLFFYLLSLIFHWSIAFSWEKKMSAAMGKCSKIRHIVRLRQMLRRWRNKARMSATRIPSDVPAGHVAVCVGTSCRRFVVRATYLNHPVFKKLLLQAEEEYGFTHQGPLSIPCDETVFEEVIRYISRSESGNSTRFLNLEDFQRYCHVGVRSKLDFWTESRPLLHGFADKTIW